MSVSSTWSVPANNSLPDFFTRDHYLDDHDSTCDGPLPDLDSIWSCPTVSFDDTSSLPVPSVPEGEQAQQPSHDIPSTPTTPLDFGCNHRRMTLDSQSDMSPLHLDDTVPLSPLHKTDDPTIDAEEPDSPSSTPGESDSHGLSQMEVQHWASHPVPNRASPFLHHIVPNVNNALRHGIQTQPT